VHVDRHEPLAGRFTVALRCGRMSDNETTALHYSNARTPIAAYIAATMEAHSRARLAEAADPLVRPPLPAYALMRLCELRRVERRLDGAPGEPRHYCVDAVTVRCYVLSPPPELADDPYIAGGLSRSSIFLSDAIPPRLAYPLVVHEYREVNLLFDALSACVDEPSFNVAKSRAHWHALEEEASVARSMHLAEDYLRFRIGVYDMWIGRAGPHTPVGEEYTRQREVFRRTLAALHRPLFEEPSDQGPCRPHESTAPQSPHGYCRVLGQQPSDDPSR